jgi:hypothetical protein
MTSPPYLPPLPDQSTDAAGVRRRLDRMEYLLEGLVQIPGTSKRVGLDVLLDFLPVGGSVIAAAMGSWLAWESRNLGMPRRTLVKMGANIGIDMLLGAIPVIGFIPDYFFKSNTRNMRMVRKWLEANHPEALTDASPGAR